ncbi:MAG: hypothetical protein EBX55_10985 [Betaproteobacteria bacterium]|nr:hypothetical protein [Betaproteobacteria bacterium]
MNPIVVKAPMGNVVGSGSNAATQGADQVQAKPPAGPSAAQSLPAGATATSKAQQATQSAAATMAPASSPASAAMPQAMPRDAAAKQGVVQTQAPSLEDKVRAALSSRLQSGGELTITYGGDVIDRSATAVKPSPSK